MTMAVWKAGVLSAVAVTSICAAASAEDEKPWGGFTASVALTSDYRFRGISQTDRDPAVQGSLQYTDDSGLFAGVWASNVDFNDAQDSPAEIDLYAGYNFKLWDTTDASIKAMYYWYPDSEPANYDYFEAIFGVTHDFGKFALSGEVAYSPDFFNETGDAVALTGGVTVPITKDFLDGLSASGHLGYQWVEETADYAYWDVGLTAVWQNVSFDARYIDTDLDRVACGSTDWCDGGVVFTVSFALPGA
jgi:uncharacterized protein (TIGR02001 family)